MRQRSSHWRGESLALQEPSVVPRCLGSTIRRDFYCTVASIMYLVHQIQKTNFFPRLDDFLALQFPLNLWRWRISGRRKQRQRIQMNRQLRTLADLLFCLVCHEPRDRCRDRFLFYEGFCDRQNHWTARCRLDDCRLEGLLNLFIFQHESQHRMDSFPQWSSKKCQIIFIVHILYFSDQGFLGNLRDTCVQPFSQMVDFVLHHVTNFRLAHRIFQRRLESAAFHYSLTTIRLSWSVFILSDVLSESISVNSPSSSVCPSRPVGRISSMFDG